MRAAVIGAQGQLGADVCRVFREAHDVIELNHDQVEICDLDGLRRVLGEIKPDVVVNTAAAHNVPRCEEEPAWAAAVNIQGAKNAAVACREAGARLIHISTDYVFGHGGTRPYIETDLPAPLSVYGATKLAGEHLIAANCEDYAICRTAGIYGVVPCRAKGGKNFVSLMLHLAETKGEVRVVTDEITTPTHTAALAEQLRIIAEKAEPGLYHVTCQGQCSWYEFAKAIFEETDTKVKLNKASVTDFPSPVQRPSYSVLENKRLQDQGLDIMPHWREALRDYLRRTGALRSA